MASCWRWNTPRLNDISLSLDAREFSSGDGVSRLISIVLSIVDWSEAAYATVRQTGQMHSRVAAGTPAKRLERLDWLTFFGKPYLELFGGEERVLATPCYRSLWGPSGIILMAAPRPDSPEIIDSTETLVALENYLGVDAFAGQGFPEIPCNVPNFNLAETVNGGRWPGQLRLRFVVCHPR